MLDPYMQYSWYYWKDADTLEARQAEINAKATATTRDACAGYRLRLAARRNNISGDPLWR